MTSNRRAFLKQLGFGAAGLCLVEFVPGCRTARRAAGQTRLPRSTPEALSMSKGQSTSPVAGRVSGKTFSMPKTLTEVTRDAAELPTSDRLKLARILPDLSETGTEPTEELQAAWDDEIARRLSELRTGTVKAVPLVESKKKIEAGFRS